VLWIVLGKFYAPPFGFPVVVRCHSSESEACRRSISSPAVGNSLAARGVQTLQHADVTPPSNHLSAALMFQMLSLPTHQPTFIYFLVSLDLNMHAHAVLTADSPPPWLMLTCRRHHVSRTAIYGMKWCGFGRSLHSSNTCINISRLLLLLFTCPAFRCLFCHIFCFTNSHRHSSKYFHVNKSTNIHAFTARHTCIRA